MCAYYNWLISICFFQLLFNPINLYAADHAKSKHGKNLAGQAASLLVERRYQDVKKETNLTQENIDHVVIDLAMDKKKKLNELSEIDFNSVRSSKWLLDHLDIDFKRVTATVEKQLLTKLERGVLPIDGAKFLHLETVAFIRWLASAVAARKSM